jgi:long-chain acyl-CoA synthetase
MPIVTSYATLGQEGLTMSLQQTHAKAIFVDPDLIPNLIKSLPKAKELKFVIYNNPQEVDQKDIDKLKEAYPHFQILSLEELRSLGELNPIEPVPPKPDDICCIMYTSGTTGTPKGVPLTHRNIVAASKLPPLLQISCRYSLDKIVAGLDVEFSYYVSPLDSVLAYLPLAHSFEWAFENCSLYWGIKMGYGSPRTLSDINMKNCVGDMKEFRPTILIGVPAVWETIKKGIEEKVSKESLFVKNVFWGALVLKSWLCEWKLPGPGILDYFVFKTVQNETGGRLRACFNGAGPLGKETRRFISYAVVLLVSGYGLTETTA